MILVLPERQRQREGPSADSHGKCPPQTGLASAKARKFGT